VEVEWQPEVFDSLELGQRQKTLIHSLVKEHSFVEFDDLIKGKGKGLIGLLAGSPGCGKTLTAEAVAEICKKPLYLVSAGELGTQPDQVDKRLKLILELSHKWDAVLLLDEADVFLQKRDNKDVKRNALVSIFLRQLEYFQGILFLTTNRINDCDPAFESKLRAAHI
jgi:SpoVK/Ycf46/Vps4 family AAA+-type ATPase